MDNLNIVDFTQRKKAYKFEAGTFTLKPPYMYLVDKVQPLAVKLLELQNTTLTQGEDAKEYKKLIDMLFKALKLILEETEEGKLQDITIDNLRLDVAVEILNDFFSQFKR